MGEETEESWERQFSAGRVKSANDCARLSTAHCSLYRARIIPRWNNVRHPSVWSTGFTLVRNASEMHRQPLRPGTPHCCHRPVKTMLPPTDDGFKQPNWDQVPGANVLSATHVAHWEAAFLSGNAKQ